MKLAVKLVVKLGVVKLRVKLGVKLRVKFGVKLEVKLGVKLLSYPAVPNPTTLSKIFHFLNRQLSIGINLLITFIFMREKLESKT